MIYTADFLGYILTSFTLSYLIGLIINGVYSMFSAIR